MFEWKKERKENVTEINDAVNNATIVNPSVGGSFESDLVGEVLLGKYQIVRRFDVSSGEADLYLAEENGKEYVVKFYRRKMALKTEVALALKKISSPYIAHTIEMGDYNGYPFEIMEYYKNGSLQGKKFSAEKIKSDIVPSINEALHILHTNNPKIIHKDIKPSNIMLLDNGKVALIDFGISSALEGDNTVISTKTGLTLDYSSPESLRRLFLEESDYYSFGITIYELFIGHTPFYGLSEEQIAQFSILQQLPFPDDMPTDLKNLIKGLTYNDITHRNELDNPNRRWTYQEVRNWCDGVSQIIPGSASGRIKVAPYKFNNVSYDSLHDLALAFASAWEDGKKQLFRGFLTGYFMTFDQDLATYCADMVEANEDNDLTFMKLLYKMDPSLVAFCWKGTVYNSLKELGEALLAQLRKKKLENKTFVDELLNNGIISNYISLIYKDNKALLAGIKGIESKSKTVKKDSKEETFNLYQLAYLISNNKTYNDGKNVFNNVDELGDHMRKLMETSFEKFNDYCAAIIDENNNLDPQFECWLMILGYADKIEDWRKTLGSK